VARKQIELAICGFYRSYWNSGSFSYDGQMAEAAIFMFLSLLFVKWLLCRNACIVWDGFLKQNQSPRLNEITAHSSISNLRVTKQ
jgi:hypothetical protein